MFNIDKTFEFCYGHRVWSQELDGRFSADLQCACRHLHGHEARVQVYFSAENLVRGMVTDFRHTEWLKKWLNTYVDHKFIIDASDPLIPQIISHRVKREPVVIREHFHVGETIDCSNLSPLLTELYGGMLIVDFVPTSENLARWLHGIVTIGMADLKINVTQVDWWETPKSKSSYVV